MSLVRELESDRALWFSIRSKTSSPFRATYHLSRLLRRYLSLFLAFPGKVNWSSRKPRRAEPPAKTSFTTRSHAMLSILAPSDNALNTNMSKPSAPALPPLLADPAIASKSNLVTYSKESDVEGHGVFAKEDIQPGQVLKQVCSSISPTRLDASISFSPGGRSTRPGTSWCRKNNTIWSFGRHESTAKSLISCLMPCIGTVSIQRFTTKGCIAWTTGATWTL
jgi:hypothetical protein